MGRFAWLRDGRPKPKRSVFLEAKGDVQTDWVVDVQLELT